MAPGSRRGEFLWLQFLPTFARKWLCSLKRRLMSRTEYLFLAVMGVGMFMLFVDVNFSSTVSEKITKTHEGENIFPYIFTSMVSKEVLLAEKERRRRTGIFTRILQKQLRKRRRGRNQTLCIHPKLDLKHDTNQFAYHYMPPLNCTGNELFNSRKGVVMLNTSVVPTHLLGECSYYYVERISDDAYTYSLFETRDSPPFEISIPHDFVRVNCVLKSTLEENKVSDEENDKLDSSAVESFRKENYDLYQLDNKKLHSKHTSKVMMNHTGEFRSEYNKTATANETSVQNNSSRERHNNDEYYLDWESDFIGDNVNDPEATYSDYDHLLAQIHPQPEVFERIAQMEAAITGPRPMKLNVLMFALDSMSHLCYQRKLPRTYKFLREELGAAILQNYNIVGDATTAAIIPMLTGRTEMILPEVRLSQWESKMVDEYPLIWKNFSDRGYVTLFAEDEPSLSTFNLRLSGFERVPTDHYMRPFWMALWDSSTRQNSERFCTGKTPHHRFTLSYLEDFFVKYHNVSKFAFGFHGELTHADNNPAQYIDDDLVTFLRRLRQRKILDNTVVIMFGDHGARYSKVRHTVQGKLEERLPFMSFAFPTKFRQKHPHLYRNLMTNTQRLTTPFDIHKTLLDILDLSRTSRSVSTPPGMSLLREIPAERTCKEAGISMHWCACMHQVRVDPKEEFVAPAALELVRHLNTQTSAHRRQCARLELSKIHSAYMVIPNERVLKYQRSKDRDQREANFSREIDMDVAHYQLMVETYPCGGLYEATIMADFRNYSNYEFTVMPGISRTNKYGAQPRCVQERYPQLRKFCCCRDFVAENATKEWVKQEQSKLNS